MAFWYVIYAAGTSPYALLSQTLECRVLIVAHRGPTVHLQAISGPDEGFYAALLARCILSILVINEAVGDRMLMIPV